MARKSKREKVPDGRPKRVCEKCGWSALCCCNRPKWKDVYTAKPRILKPLYKAATPTEKAILRAARKWERQWAKWGVVATEPIDVALVRAIRADNAKRKGKRHAGK